MFNIIEALRNYFTCKLLLNYLISKVALYFNINQWQLCLVVSCSDATLSTASAAPEAETKVQCHGEFW